MARHPDGSGIRIAGGDGCHDLALRGLDSPARLRHSVDDHCKAWFQQPQQRLVRPVPVM